MLVAVRWSGVRWALAYALSLLACDPGQVSVVPVDRPPTEAAGTLHVTVLRPDGSPAADAEVGWVRMRHSKPLTFHAGRTDAGGVIDLLDLHPGAFYWVGAEAPHSDLGLVGGGQIAPAPDSGRATVDVSLNAPRRSGIVISEVYGTAPPVWETANYFYNYSQYVELANLSDRTLYLDGMLLGKAYYWWWSSEPYGHHRCPETEGIRTDPEGVWVHVLWRLPGAGTHYPLEPDGAALLAVSAADHTGIHESMLDLSNADLEFGAPGVADNPSAGNIAWLGPGTVPPELGDYGLPYAFWILAAPGEARSFPSMADPGATRTREEILRLPAALVEDVAFIWWDGGEPPEPSLAEPCRYPVHRSFDRLPGGFVDDRDLYTSAQRRRVTVGGRSILLDTNTSWVDFERAERTPGWLP